MISKMCVNQFSNVDGHVDELEKRITCKDGFLQRQDSVSPILNNDLKERLDCDAKGVGCAAENVLVQDQHKSCTFIAETNLLDSRLPDILRLRRKAEIVEPEVTQNRSL